MFEGEDQPGVVPDLNSGISPSADDIQFDLDFQSILPDSLDLKTPQLITANSWDPNALRRFSFSNITGLQGASLDQIGDSVFAADSVPQSANSKVEVIKAEPSSVNVPPASNVTPVISPNEKRQRTPSVRAREAALAVSKPRSRKPVVTKGKAGKCVRNTPSPIPLNTNGILPPDHRPARGRGRQNQLARMTKAQIEAEAEARLEKNRQAARECRLRRKQHVELLENRVAQLERERRQQDKYIKQLQAKLAAQTA
jgi:hypothetical protein